MIDRLVIVKNSFSRKVVARQPEWEGAVMGFKMGYEGWRVHAELFTDRADNCAWVLMKSSDMVFKYEFVLMASVANCAWVGRCLVMVIFHVII